MSTYRNAKLLVQENCSNFLWMARDENLHPTDQIVVGRRVTALHRAKGWTAEAFAKLFLKISPSKLNNWTRGRHKIPPGTAATIAQCTDSSLNFIYAGNSAGMDPEFVLKVTEELSKIAEKEDGPPKRKRKRA